MTASKDKIAEALKQHRLWMLSQRNRGKRFALRDLQGIVLPHANLSQVDLQHANLSQCDLRGANLDGADIGDTNLHSANLSQASLVYANLSCTLLHYADLSNADLGTANLTHAKIAHANLKGARLPPPTMLLLVNWGKLPDDLAADCIRYDASLYPNPEVFNEWAKGGDCPYEHASWNQAVQFWEDPRLWPGLDHPVPNALDLVKRLFEAKGVKR